jgi:hypothetical protein
MACDNTLSPLFQYFVPALGHFRGGQKVSSRSRALAIPVPSVPPVPPYSYGLNKRGRKGYRYCPPQTTLWEMGGKGGNRGDKC